MSRHLSRYTRCVGCRFAEHLCVCDWIHPTPTETQVVVVLHPREQNKPSNSGHFVRRLLSSGDVRVADAGGGLSAPVGGCTDRRSFLLFPHEEAQELDVRLRDADSRPIELIVPDAPWRQARRMATRWPALRHLPRVRLPPGPAGGFGLRSTALGPSALGTLEAVGRALGILECHLVEHRFMRLVERVVHHGLYARGRRPPDDELRSRLRGDGAGRSIGR